jgi:hypothetical protein
LGLGTIATQNSASVSITGGSISGITDLAVADGGTGASDAAGARTNLGAQATVTGAASTITSSDLTASRAPASDGSGKVAASSVTSTELGYVSGVTSAIQTQISAKANTASPTLTGTPAAPTAATGTNTTQIATTAFVNAEIANDVAVRSAYVSSDQTITTGALLTLAHGLGQAPKTTYLEIVCATAEAGFSVNDVVGVSAADNTNSSGANRQMSIYYDATNVYVRYSNNEPQQFVVANKSTGTPTALTNSSWRLRVRAFA